MGRNIYSKYSLYQQKVKKGKRNFFMLLFFLGLLSVVFFLGKNLKGKTLNEVDEPGNVQAANEVVEDEAERLFFWWSYDYSTYRQLTVRNHEQGQAIPKDTGLAFSLNHKKLVDDNKSQASGNDLRIVYLNTNNIYTEVETKIEDANTTYTRITFTAVADLAANSNDNNYFLYYGNPTANRFGSNPNINGKQDLDYLISYSKEQSPRLHGNVSRKWVLKDDPDPRDFKFNITADIEGLTGVKNVTYEVIGTNRKGFMTLVSGNTYEATVNAKDLIPGTYYIQAQTIIDNLDLKSQKVQFYVSYPLYVTWTQDWEGYDVSDAFLKDMEDISAKHNMPITHFFNPRIYIANDVPTARRNRMTEWVINRKNTANDEIALHLHMHYDLVSAAGVTPKKSPAWGGRENGHDVLTSAYNYDEITKLLNWSKRQFSQHGLGTPTSFRAGGWFAGPETLRALQDTGFTLDSSGRTAYDWGTNKVQGPWNLQSTTAPYRPSANNQNIYDPSTALNIWEFPNNGADSWTYSTNDLIERFKDNYQNRPLEKRQIVTYLSHPHWFNKDKPKIDATLDYTDNYLYSADKGPVKYITLEQAEKIWETYP